MTPLLKPSFFRQVVYDYVSQEHTLSPPACAWLTELLIPFLRYFVKKIQATPSSTTNPIPYEQVCVWAYKALKKTQFATDAVAYMEHYVEQTGYASDPEAPLSERAQTSIKIGFVIRIMEQFAGTQEGIPLDDLAMVACGAFVEFIIRRVSEAAMEYVADSELNITPNHLCQGIQTNELMGPVLSKYLV